MIFRSHASRVAAAGVMVVLLATSISARGTEPALRRFIYNSDGDNMFDYRKPPVTPRDFHPYVDEIANAGVTTLFMSCHIGMKVNFPGKVNELLGTFVTPEQEAAIADGANAKEATLERAAANLRSLVAAGHDPLGVIIDRARERKLETFISFRLNEVHLVETPDSIIISDWWRKHPEWRIGSPGDKLPQVYLDILGPRTHPIVASWLPAGMNFAVPEVRAQRLAELKECCERYPIDGIDLDFQRFPMYFKPGEEERNRPVMTEWMRDVRRMTEEVGRKRGRALMVSVRIMDTPGRNTAIGLDPAKWVADELVDLVTVSHYLRNDARMPIGEFRALLPNVPIYGSIEVEPEPETYRRLAGELWKDGVDGLLMFNFFTTRERGKEPPFQVLRELKDASGATTRP